ncbi:glycine-rich domain-containing protein 1-like [Hibiscus syriacus]|uniref:glycine-rich domain-containing protein 1-like n=1 Tax=Hibiscus syriacus TaxID=106335 RepID=UPI001921C297|nr:glycine-rich domain-containing protein 1-like [Hibiscus syriacus]
MVLKTHFTFLSSFNPIHVKFGAELYKLNPFRYNSGCEELYGMTLDNSSVVYSLQGTCKRKTEEIWNIFYPDEPNDFDFTRASSENAAETISGLKKHTEYDLISAVKKQSPFFYQVSKERMNNDIFVQEAVARYKGFLHLINRNREKSIKRFCVPTYDIDLIWHTHQLHPVSYCIDLNKTLGKILEHDDTESDRTKGKKLDVGFSGTTKQWEDTFGTRYWKAGAMYRGNSPSPITTITCVPDILPKEVDAADEFLKIIKLLEMRAVEVFLDVVEVKNLPNEKKGNLFVLFSKTQPDVFCNNKQKLSYLSLGRNMLLHFSVNLLVNSSLNSYHIQFPPYQEKRHAKLPLAETVSAGKSYTRVIDETQAEVIRLQMRYTAFTPVSMLASNFKFTFHVF